VNGEPFLPEAAMKSFMIKLFPAVFFAVFFFVQTTNALPVGAPARTLEDGGFSLSSSIAYTDMDVDDENVKSKSIFFKGAFSGGDGVSPYLRLGFADLEASGVEGSLDFAFGGGVLLDLMTQKSGAGFRVSLDAQVAWIDSSEGSASLDLFEGQLALLGSTSRSGTNAYAGLATSFLSLDGAGGGYDDNGKTHFFFGLDYFMDYNFYFSAEAHLFGEDTVAIGVGYLF
jgi:hypothetical protein